MTRKLLIRDVTLRDGQQSLLATRMKQAQIDRVLPLYSSAGLYAMEVWGGAVPDSVMRYLGENPWDRLEIIKKSVGDISKLTALSRGRNLFGYTPYPDEIIEGFCRNSIESGLGIMRIFDALNDLENVKSTIKYVKKYGGIADCAICYTIAPQFGFFEKVKAKLNGRPVPNNVFSDEYYVAKAKEMQSLGADMITIKDMSGLIPPKRTGALVRKLKQAVNLPIDFHTHCTPGFGLASMLTGIINGVDIVDTAMWNFSGGTAAPSLEFIYVFCQKLGIEVGANMEAAAEINKLLIEIRKEMADVDGSKVYPKPFNPLTDKLPAEIDALFDTAITAAKADNEEALLDACHKIEAHFNFPAPNIKVKDAEIPGGMFSNMQAQLKQLQSEHIMDDAMKLIPQVRYDAGLPPLVTPTSQIVGAQAVNCAMSLAEGKPMYSNISNQFRSLVKGEYGKTPIAIDPEFRKQITGSEKEIGSDLSGFQRQPNPVLPEAGGRKLAENEKEELLLELFPMVAKQYLTNTKKAQSAPAAAKPEPKAESKPEPKAIITGKAIEIPLPGRILQVLIKPGDTIKKGDHVAVLEAMKMENTIESTVSGKVVAVFGKEGEATPAKFVFADVDVNA
jgi:pyruvate carboxylase subunit B